MNAIDVFSATWIVERREMEVVLLIERCVYAEYMVLHGTAFHPQTDPSVPFTLAYTVVFIEAAGEYTK